MKAKVSSLEELGSLYYALLPLYLPTKFLGLSAYSLVNDCKAPCKVSGKGALYSLSVVLFYIGKSLSNWFV